MYAAALVTREFSQGIPIPYVALIVELDEQEGLLVWSALYGSTELIDVGSRVRVAFVPITDEITLAYFERDEQ